MIKVKASKPACPLANSTTAAASACTYWPHRYHRPRCCKCCRCPHRPKPHWQYYPYYPYYPGWTYVNISDGYGHTNDYTSISTTGVATWNT